MKFSEDPRGESFGSLTPRPEGDMDHIPLLKVEKVAKRFGAIQALKGVTLHLDRGEVLGIVGDNGAGKSTLLKILSGALIPDKGQIYLEGHPVTFRSPMDARLQGVEMVYQDLSLCDTLDVAANLFLGREPIKRILGTPFLDRRVMHQRAGAILEKLRIRIPSTHLIVENLSGGQRQAIAIGRAVFFQPKVLILDEPTSALAAREVEEVLNLTRRLAAAGVGVIFVSHRLHDVLRVSDRIAVLYEGRKVAERQAGETDVPEIIRLMEGIAEGKETL